MIRSVLALLGCGIVWTVLVHFRPFFMSAQCTGAGVRLCDPSQIPWFDFWAWGYQYSWADEASFWTQYSAAVPALILFFLVPKSQKLTTLLYFLLCTLANGALTEAIRVIVQRPRPFVFGALEHAESLAHYTSFVSGHTSFTACMATGATLLVRRGRASKLNATQATALLAFSWTLCVATAVLRVLAGRHFISDTVGGMICGSLAAGFAFLFLKRT